MKFINYISRIEEHQLIVFIIFISGLLYIYITPPFQVPDSPNHIFKSYQLSEGIFFPLKKNSSVGGYIPKSLDSINKALNRYRFSPYSKITDKKLEELSNIKLNPKNKKFIHFPNTSLYSIISYLPQTITIYFLRKMEISPLRMLYITKITSFLFWLLLIYFSLKLLPFKKFLLGTLAIIPVSIFINGSYSADLMTNGLTFLFISLILNLTLTKRKLTYTFGFILLLVITLIGLSKLIYVTVLLLFLIVPVSKFKNIFNYLFFFFLLGLFGGGSAIIWKSQIDDIYTPYSQYNPEYRDQITLGYKADMNLQMDYIKNNKIKTIGVFASSFKNQIKNTFKEFIGLLGWNKLTLANWFIFISYLILLFYSIVNHSKEYVLSIKQKIIIIATIISTTILIMLSQYLTWNEVGSEIVFPLTGRYFIPISPLFLLLFTNKKYFFKKYIFPITFIFFSLLSTTYTYLTIQDYFISTHQYNERWSYDYNLNEKTKYFKNTKYQINDNVAGKIDSTIMKKVITLDGDSPYSYTISFFNVKKGEKVIVGCWRDTDNVRFVFDDIPDNKYYTAIYYETEKQNGKFKYIAEEYFAPANMDELKIYLYNSIGNTCKTYGYNIKFYEIKK